MGQADDKVVIIVAGVVIGVIIIIIIIRYVGAVCTIFLPSSIFYRQ